MTLRYGDLREYKVFHYLLCNGHALIFYLSYGLYDVDVQRLPFFVESIHLSFGRRRKPIVHPVRLTFAHSCNEHNLRVEFIERHQPGIDLKRVSFLMQRCPPSLKQLDVANLIVETVSVQTQCN